MKKNRLKICVVGLGYVGLPTALILSKTNIVFGYDKNINKINFLQNGRIEGTFEKKFKLILKQSLENKSFIPINKITSANIFIVAVPTPLNKNKKPELKYVKKSFYEISKVLKKGDLIILESTCPVGTTKKLTVYLSKLRNDLSFPLNFNYKSSDINLAYCPERVIPGNTYNEIINNNRVIGGMNMKSSLRAKKFYKSFTRNNLIAITSADIAELAKLVENSFRNVNISFANEISLICDRLKINPHYLRSLTNMHPRVNMLEAGPGIGGHCIAVDPFFLSNTFKKESVILQSSHLANDLKLKNIYKKIKRLAETYKDKKIILCGMTYKKNIDDLRESPSITIYNKLKRKFRNRLYCCDPLIENKENKLGLKFIKVDIIKKTNDILVLLVDHNIFKKFQPKSKLIIDTKGKWITSEIYSNDF